MEIKGVEERAYFIRVTPNPSFPNCGHYTTGNCLGSNRREPWQIVSERNVCVLHYRREAQQED
jgi:hypothetical protein